MKKRTILAGVIVFLIAAGLGYYLYHISQNSIVGKWQFTKIPQQGKTLLSSLSNAFGGPKLEYTGSTYEFDSNNRYIYNTYFTDSNHHKQVYTDVGVYLIYKGYISLSPSIHIMPDMKTAAAMQGGQSQTLRYKVNANKLTFMPINPPLMIYNDSSKGSSIENDPLLNYKEEYIRQ